MKHISYQLGRRHIAGAAAITLISLTSLSARAEHAVLSVTSGSNGGCYDLYAGQTTDAGDVCYSISGNSLRVSYQMQDDWQLVEAHLWVGEDQDGYPMAKNGNPKVGNFPYNSGDIVGVSTYSFSVPLGSVQSHFDLDDLDSYCNSEPLTIYAMSHAALQRVDYNGDVIQTETGWGDGEGAVQRGSWATRTAVTLSVTCDNQPPQPKTVGQETAIMIGNIVLNDKSDDVCMIQNSDGTYSDAFGANRWGWQAGPLWSGSYVFDIWAAAGNNELNNGTNVGYVDIEVSAGNVTATPVLYDGFTAEETHIYIGTDPVCSGAFGKDWNSLASTDLDTIAGVYVGVHMSVTAACGVNPASPDNFCDE